MKRVELPPLPYDYNALEPVISEEIMRLHHDKHHASYVKGANEAMEKLKNGEGDLRAVLRDLTFHMNGHVLHTIFWHNMRPPEEDNEPNGELMDVIERNFGSFQRFKELFTRAAVGVEGSGWAVLAANKDDLYVYQVEKHNLMHIAGFKPLLVIDVWEHAYYLDYRNDRKSYVERWWQVVNWDDVERRL